MEQDELRALEAKCIQEEAPWCTAACPLHVDCRGMLSAAAKGDWKAARKVLERAMPLPEILGRICDHPCEAPCKRGEVGDTIRIGAVERACVEAAGPQSRLLPIPRKPFRVAMLGAGLSALVAASDLLRKGFGVTLLTGADKPGGTLLDLQGTLLPEKALELEMDKLLRQGMEVRIGQAIDQALLDALLEEFDGLYLDRDEEAVRALVTNEPDQLSLATDHERVFAGGGSVVTQYSPIQEAAWGRKGGGSLERLRQKVSLTAQRGKEGPFETRLFTSLEGVEPNTAITPADSEAGYTLEEARAEAARCLHCECMECVKHCLYMQRYKGYPKSYARAIYNNETIVKGTRQANRMIDSCMLCNLCTSICPNDFSMADLCKGTRQSMVRKNTMPPSAFEFALEELRCNMSERFYMARPTPGGGKTEYLFFPGCQLAGSRPEHVKSAFGWLGETLGNVGLLLGCCGAPADWAGQVERYKDVLATVRASWEELGKPKVVTACTTCRMVFDRELPEFQAVTLWELMAERDLPQGAQALAGAMPLHDPCTSRELGSVQNAARAVLAKLRQEVEELPMGRELTECCGFGGLMSCCDPKLGRDVAARRGAQAEGDFLAYCAMCRDALALSGKRVAHILDLLFPLEEDPAGRPSPGFSDRMDSRDSLRRELLQNYWHQESRALEEHEKIVLHMTPEVRTMLDDRHILREDVQRVIHHAMETGRSLVNPENGHTLAYHRHVRVTYWVEYAPADSSDNGGFTVCNAYSHRMVIPGARGEK